MFNVEDKEDDFEIVIGDDSNLNISEVNGRILYLPQQVVAFSKTVEKNVLFSMSEKENSEQASNQLN